MSILAILIATATAATGAQAQSTEDLATLSRKLDADMFAAYNACDLDAFGRFLAQDVEFYHDKGGLMIGRQPVVDAVKKNICDRVRREVIEDSLTVYPMDNYGMVQLGEHRFCTAGTTTCTGVARFVHLWRQTDGTWETTRIISYDHQPLAAP